MDILGKARIARAKTKTATAPPSQAATVRAWIGSMPAMTAPRNGRAMEATSRTEVDIFLRRQGWLGLAGCLQNSIALFCGDSPDSYREDLVTAALAHRFSTPAGTLRERFPQSLLLFPPSAGA